MVSATAALGGGSRFRQRKLNVKAALAILKESDIESDTTGVAGTGDDAADAALGIGMGLGVGGLPKVESGVESKEEKVWQSCFLPWHGVGLMGLTWVNVD